MLRKTRDLKGCRLGAQDGELGHVRDLYFDEHTWTVRYLVADTGKWLPGRKVLISPFAVKGLHFAAHKIIEVSLTRAQIEQSPPIELHETVSRRFEAEYLKHFGWPCYWAGPLLWGVVPVPTSDLLCSEPPALPSKELSSESEDSHLRSVNEVAGYAV
ncbi:MAG TPA: PRC-barrel domain-containing protein, partial [Verrucomicrobiae bacterium]|nr:PRC-barrel domain-containing protein [Verrucomicrobiae bacterium]